MPKLKSQSRDLKEAVLQLAIKTLAKKKGSDLSFRSIAKELGVQHNAIVYHFGSKDDLTIAIAARGFKLLTLSLESGAKKKALPREQLLEIGSSYLGFALENPEFYRVMFGAFLSHLAPKDPDLNRASEAAKSIFHTACLKQSWP